MLLPQVNSQSWTVILGAYFFLKYQIDGQLRYLPQTTWFSFEVFEDKSLIHLL